MRSTLPGRSAALLAACCLALAALLPGAPAAARSTGAALPEIAVSELPAEGRDVLALIRKGGPFRHDRDGVTFGNREQLLPAKPRGYYLEYTVRTPGVKSRGARRIVCGGAPTAPDACYYTGDHYASFKRIRE
jgi:ribonuclease T1